MQIETFGNLVLERGGFDLSNPIVQRSNPPPAPSDLFAVDTELWTNHTDSGEVVTPNTAKTFGAVQGAWRFLGATEASLQCHLYQRRPDGFGRDRAVGNYLYPILHDSPNEEQTSFEFWQAMRVNRAAWGNAYALLKHSGAGRWTEMIPLRPDWMRVTRNPNGTRIYQYRPAWGPHEGNYLASDVVHVREMGDDLEGWSPIRLLREGIGVGMAAQRATGAFYKNGARMSGVLTSDKPVRPGPDGSPSPEEESFQRKYAGAHNTGKVLVIGGGSKFTSTTIPPDDAQFLATVKDASRLVWMAYGIPPFIMGDTEKSTSWGTGIEQQVIGLLKFTMRPSLETTQQAFEMKLLGRGNRDLFIEFDIDAFLEADAKTQAEVFAIMRQNGVIMTDEWRAKKNLNPIGGEEGEALLVNGTMIPIKVALAKTNAPATPPAA
jgi:HK97 family phage portal protein